MQKIKGVSSRALRDEFSDKKNIDAFTAQKIASNVWKAYDKYLPLGVGVSERITSIKAELVEVEAQMAKYLEELGI